MAHNPFAAGLQEALCQDFPEAAVWVRLNQAAVERHPEAPVVEGSRGYGVMSDTPDVLRYLARRMRAVSDVTTQPGVAVRLRELAAVADLEADYLPSGPR